MTELLLGIDIGTASTKGVLARPNGAIVATAAVEHEMQFPRPGWVEHDVENAWWRGIQAVCGELLPGHADAVRAVGVSGIGPCVVPCDADDVPLRPAILYGVDTRAEAEVRELTERLGEDEVRRAGGSTLSSQALGPKLLWLARNEPDVWARMCRWHMASSFAVARLTGEWVLDRSSASQCDPYYDLETDDWNRAWVEETCPGLPLPPLVWPGEIAGRVTPAGAAATGLPVGVPVVAGIIDAWAEALSVGVRSHGDMMLMYGSTLFLLGGVESPSDAAGIWTTRGVDPGSLTAAAGMATSGSLTAWLRNLFGAPAFSALIAEARAVPAGARGLLMLPYFQGERTPILDPRARGVVAGLTLSHSRGDIYRAALEGVAFGVRHNLESIGVGDTRLVAVGGGTAGRLWPQIVSSVLGRPQQIPRVTIGASLGDAQLAAEAVGLLPKGSSWARATRTVEPDVAVRELYDERYALYRRLYPDTSEVQHALAEAQIREGASR